MRDAQERNRFGVPDVSGRGVQDIIYSHGFVSLGDDEAMVVELDPRAAALWGIGCYSRTWYEPLDYATRVDQSQPPPGHARCRRGLRVVIAGRGPGSANWLDTQGRRGAHHRALVPPAGCPDDPRRDRAVGEAGRPSARRPSDGRRRHVRRRDPGAGARTSPGGTAHERSAREPVSRRATERGPSAPAGSAKSGDAISASGDA